MVRCYLGLGSNLGDRVGNISGAVECLGTDGDIVVRRLSGMYETKPWGYTQQDDFVNAVAEVETCLEPDALLERLKGIEVELGRSKGPRWGPRRIDIDILLYGDRIVARPGLRIPHPSMCRRAFVLVPLAEIAPGLVHPETGRKMDYIGKNNRAVLTVCEDRHTHPDMLKKMIPCRSVMAEGTVAVVHRKTYVNRDGEERTLVILKLTAESLGSWQCTRKVCTIAAGADNHDTMIAWLQEAKLIAG